MTRDRIVEVSKKAAQRVAKAEVGTPAKQKYVKRLAELKTKRAVSAGRAADREKGRLRA
jgi:rare lipoprotein A (peptidoglycan hydrolase)